MGKNTEKKRYCMVLEIKEEFVEQYKDLHVNAWLEMLKAEKECGFQEELIWLYKNMAIIYMECDDIDKVYARASKISVEQKWDKTVSYWLKQLSPLEEKSGIPVCIKIFDLNQQLNGKLDQY